MQSTREINQACLVRHLTAENAHRLDETLATLTEDCLFEDVALQKTFNGHAGAAEYYRMWWSAFAIKVQLKGGTRHWIGDDLFVSETSYVGTHVGEFLGIAPSGRPIQFRFVVFVTFRNGLFAGERFYYDLSTLLRQIGAERLP